MSICYIAKFENKKSFIKIGITTDWQSRVKQLERSHGKTLEFYLFDCKDNRFVESTLHGEFYEFRVKVSGEGGTEFFNESCLLDVINRAESLSTLVTREIEDTSEERLLHLTYWLLGQKPCKGIKRDPCNLIFVSGVVYVKSALELGYEKNDILDRVVKKLGLVGRDARRWVKGYKLAENFLNWKPL